MEKYKVGQKIWTIEINKFQIEPSEWSNRQNGVSVENLEILGVSKYKIVLNDDWFTTLDNDDRENYKKEKYNSYFDDITVSIRTGGSIFGDGVFIKLYSTKEPDEKLLNKMVAKAANKIEKEYGFLFNGIINELYNIINNYDK
jgi:hypothetical protein